jgi:SAM-dependent methyltransferase
MAGHRDVRGLSSYELTAAGVPDDARTVLDLACGDGALLHTLGLRLGARAELIGADLSVVDLDLAPGRLAGFRSRLLCEPADRVSLASESVDAVVCHFALMLLRPIEPVLAEVARVLRPGALFIACIPAGVSVDRSAVEARELLMEVIRGDVPTYPETGLGDSRVNDDEAVRGLLAAAGFESPNVEAHTVTCDLTPAVTFAQMRDYYWWDMIRDAGRERLAQQLPPLLEKQAGAGGVIRQESKLRMITARRRLR